MQHVLARPWIAAGVALVGAGAIAATPVVAPLPGLPAAHSSAIALTADFDPFASWQEVFTTAQTNATAIADAFSAVPFVAQQQAIANQIGYLEGLLNGSTNINDVFTAIQTNATAAFNAATFLGGEQLDLNVLSNETLDLDHGLIFLALTGQLGDLGFPVPEAPIPAIVDFLSSPLSGILIGQLGPAISPLVALSNSIGEIGAALNVASPDWTAALQDLANIPANMAGAFLNGATLDLSSLIPLINEADLIPLPEGVTLDGLSFAFGGLFSPGSVSGASGVGELGGSLFNSLGLTLNGVPFFGTLDVVGQAFGPLSAWESMQEIVAGALGWDGVGNPLEDLFGSM